MHESFAIFNVLMWWRCDGKFGVWGGSFLELNTAKTENSRFAVQGKVFRSEQCSWQTQAWKVGVFRQRCYHALVQTHFRKRCRLRILYAVRNGDVSLGFSPWYCGACASPLHLGGTVCTSRRSTWRSPRSSLGVIPVSKRSVLQETRRKAFGFLLAYIAAEESACASASPECRAATPSKIEHALMAIARYSVFRQNTAMYEWSCKTCKLVTC